MLRSAIKHRTHCVCGKCHQTRDAKHKISLFGQIQLPSHNFLLEVILLPHMRARSAAAGLGVSFPDLILHVPCRSGIGYEIEHLGIRSRTCTYTSPLPCCLSSGKSGKHGCELERVSGRRSEGLLHRLRRRERSKSTDEIL